MSVVTKFTILVSPSRLHFSAIEIPPPLNYLDACLHDLFQSKCGMHFMLPQSNNDTATRSLVFKLSL